MNTIVLDFSEIGLSDVARVGGKNASLGELHRALRSKGVGAVDGFATTADAYREFLRANGLDDRLRAIFEGLDPNDVAVLADKGAEARRLIMGGTMPASLRDAVVSALVRLREREPSTVELAVRSSATAEDLPEASFAGQQESFLNVRGDEEVVAALQRCYASMFTDRAINYRANLGFDQLQVALSVGIQPMVHADEGCAGVIFTLDPDSGFRDVIVINGSYGLGESVVKGSVTPDEWIVHKRAIGSHPVPIISRTLGTKETSLRLSADGSGNVVVPTDETQRRRFCLDDADVGTLGAWALAIEQHYSEHAGRPMPMDVEWAKDGVTGRLHILQARPETVHSRASTAVVAERYVIDPAGARVLVEGLAVGEKVAKGSVRIVRDPSEIETVRPGDVLVTVVTNPDWEPIMRKVSAIVTDSGGRTAHAAIVSRELGLACIVGAGNATMTLKDGETVTVSCAEGARGRVYDGAVRFSVEQIDASHVSATRTHVMVNVGQPDLAFRLAELPCDGVGLARVEFIINHHVGVHPMAIARYPKLADARALEAIRVRVGAEKPADYFVRTLSEGIARIAAAFFPRPVIVRTSDFKTNEYARLLGGEEFEPHEENPMLGFRGASRYYDERYAEGFALECAAILRARREMGLSNIVVMIPFCRTVDEARKVIEAMRENGLRQGEEGLEVYAMCEIPSNVISASAFLEVFDGYSIGSNDLTQLTLGVDRDSGAITTLFDEMDPAVVAMISQVIAAARAAGKPIGICGQAPSDRPEMLRLLVEQGITSISVNPDVAVRTKLAVAELEARMAAPVAPSAARRSATAVADDGDPTPPR